MGLAIGGNRLGSGPQGLSGDLAAEQPGRIRTHRHAAEQVVLDPLEGQQLRQPGVDRANNGVSHTRHGPLISHAHAADQGPDMSVSCAHRHDEGTRYGRT